MKATVELVIGNIDRILSLDGLQQIWLYQRFGQAEVARSDPRVAFVTPGDYPFGVTDALMGDYGNAGASSLQLLWITGHRRVLLLGTDGRYQTRESGPAINHCKPDYIPAGFSDHAPARTDAWCEVVADARTQGMELWLGSPGSALSAIAGLDKDTGALK